MGHSQASLLAYDHYIARVDTTVLAAHFTNEQREILVLPILDRVKRKHTVAFPPVERFIRVS